MTEEQLRRKANQHWEMAERARQDGDQKNSEDHTKKARGYERQLLDLQNRGKAVKLYRLEAFHNLDCNCARAFIIRAESPEAARLLAAEKAGDEGRAVWLDPIRSSCAELTVTGYPGVILRDFNAG